MADNVTFQSATLATAPSGFVAATDDVGGVHYQRIKLDIGGDGATSPVLTSNPLPVTVISSHGQSGTIWTATHVPASNTQATTTRSSAGVGVKNIATGFTATLAATATAPTAVQIVINLIDGGTGGTTYLWRTVVSLPAQAGAITSFVRSNLWLPGTANTSMTLEFSAAGGANTIESVTLEGTTE